VSVAVSLSAEAPAAQAPQVEVRVDPALAEAAVRTALSAPGADQAAVAAHRARADAPYGIADPAARDAAFARLAVSEFEALGLARPVLAAIGERPALADRVRVVLLGDVGRRGDESVTCEPGGARLGVRLTASRLADATGLLAWARHALGHAEDTLDPEFGFEPGWDDPGAVWAPAAARLHRLWDVSVDARLAADGRLPEGPTRRRHREALAADLRGAPPHVADAALERLWSGPRPVFADLARWAADPAALAGDALPAGTPTARPDRCPLCRFPGDDVAPPDTALAAAVLADYPDWVPAQGLCGRCADRYRFSSRLGGRP